MDLVGLNPNPFFSALTLIIGSFDASPMWPIMCLVGR